MIALALLLLAADPTPQYDLDVVTRTSSPQRDNGGNVLPPVAGTPITVIVEILPKEAEGWIANGGAPSKATITAVDGVAVPKAPVKGELSERKTIVFTFEVTPKKAGTFEVPIAIRCFIDRIVDGENVSSNMVQLTTEATLEIDGDEVRILTIGKALPKHAIAGWLAGSAPDGKRLIFVCTTWFKGCAEDLPRVLALGKALAVPVEILEDESDPEKVTAWIGRHAAALGSSPVGYGDVGDLMTRGSFPSTILVGDDGKLLWMSNANPDETSARKALGK